MYGWLTEQEGRGIRRPRPERVSVCGLSVLRAGVRPPGGARPGGREKQLYRAALALKNAGAHRVLNPTDPAWRDALARAGLPAVETAELCRAAAAPLAIAALTLRGWRPERAAVALAGARVTTSLFRAAETLAGQVCTLQLDVPAGGAELARRLQREYGLPVLLGGAVHPALTVAFDNSRRENGPTLALWGERPGLLGTEVCLPGLEAPADCEPMSLLAALWESGRVSGGALRACPEGKKLDIVG